MDQKMNLKAIEKENTITALSKCIYNSRNCQYVEHKRMIPGLEKECKAYFHKC